MSTPTPAYEERAQALRERVYQLPVRAPVRQLAEAMGVSRSYMSNILGGRYRSAPMLERIEAYLDELEAINRG